jgi:hypothetical protein
MLELRSSTPAQEAPTANFFMSIVSAFTTCIVRTWRFTVDVIITAGFVFFFPVFAVLCVLMTVFEYWSTRQDGSA